MCDSMVTLTGDGLLFAKNSDRHPNEPQVLEWIAAADHEPGARVACTWVQIAQADHTHAVLLSRPWWMWGAEMGANQHGVVIGNEAVYTRGPDGEKALLGMDLVRLALERASTAEDAVAEMVRLLERHGQGGPCGYRRPGYTYDSSFLVADPTTALVLETCGRRWATEVVAGPGRSISNGLSIPSFARAHSRPLRTWVVAASTRRHRTETAASRATSPGDLMAALRDHGPSPSPAWSPVHGGLRAPCVHAGGVWVSSQTTASWVSDLRGAPRHWATATAAPCTSLFKPVRIDGPVDLGPPPTNVFDRRSLWWRHELLHRATMRAYGAPAPGFDAERQRTESGWLADPPASTAAFAEADRLEREWLSDLAGTGGTGTGGTPGPADRRPAFVRRSWRVLDREAGFAT